MPGADREARLLSDPGQGAGNRQRLKGADKANYELHDAIWQVLPKVTTWKELKSLLRGKGISIYYKYKRGTEQVQGISFRIGDLSVKGSSIDRSLSYGAISRQLEQHRQQAQLMSLGSKQHSALGQTASSFSGTSKIKELIPDPIEGLLSHTTGQTAYANDYHFKKKKCRKKKEFAYENGRNGRTPPRCRTRAGPSSKRLEKLEEKPAPNTPQITQAPDYSSQFEELKALLKRHDLSVQGLQIYALIASIQETVTKLPKVLPIRHHHHFEDKSKGFLIGGIVCLVTAAISTGMCFSLYRENGRLKETDIKYTMIRQTFQDAAIWADSVYYSNPEEIKQKVRLLEVQASTPQQ